MRGLNLRDTNITSEKEVKITGGVKKDKVSMIIRQLL